jgi:hypothetical protein
VGGDETAADDRPSLPVFRTSTSVVHLLVAIVTTAPLAWQMGNRLPQGEEHVATVPWFNLWSLRWTAQQLPHGLSQWWDAPIFWPSRGTYANSELQPLTGLVFGALRFVISDTAAYGVILIAALALNGIAVNLLARRLGASRWPATMAGIVAQTAPFLFDQLGVLQLLMLWPVVFALDAILCWTAEPRLRIAARFGALVAVALLTCGYHALLVCMCLAVAAPVLVERGRAADWRRRVGGVLIAVLTAGLLAAPFVLGQQRRLASIRWTDETIRIGSASWDDLGPGGSRWFGSVLVILGVAGFVIGRRQRFVRFLAVLVVAAALFSLGSRLSIFGWHPYSVLVHHVTAIARLRSPFRATALAQMALAVLSALAFERLWALRSHVARGSAALLVAVWLISSDLGAGSMTKMPPLDTAWIEWLAAHPDGPIVMLPAAPGSKVADFEATTAAMLQGLEHGHPLVNGYSGFFPSGHRELRERLASFPDQASVTELRDLGVTYAVADAAWWSTDRDAAARRLGLQIVLSGPEGVVIDLGR